MACKIFQCEVESCNACGQDECLPARQFNREVEIHKAREAAVAEWSDTKALTEYYRAFNKVLDTLFGGGR
jgi:hypothetical protein